MRWIIGIISICQRENPRSAASISILVSLPHDLFIVEWRTWSVLMPGSVSASCCSLDIENTSRCAITGRFAVEGNFARCFCQVSGNALLALCVRKLRGRRACAVRIHLDAVM